LIYSSQLERAIHVAIAAHDGQFRKNGDSVPYVVHPLQVALYLAHAGCEESAVVAGVLHDVVEDCDEWTVERVQLEFGADVATIVDDLTEDKSLTWDERKQWAVDHVPSMSAGAVAVKAADKLQNMSSLRSTLQSADDPTEVWKHFTGGREKTLAASRALVDALCERAPLALTEPLRRVMADLEC
jgi:(p)ppGpp synthase/HD superfamily hydrolase